MQNENLTVLRTATMAQNEELLFGGLTYSAKAIAKFDEKQLMRALHQSNWKRMDAATRLRIYQEFENRQARLDGRKPIQIRADKPMEPWHYGSHITMPDGSEIIYINPRFVSTGKMFKNSDTSIFNAASGLNAVLHEGRHSFQHHALRNNLHLISEIQKIEWAVSMPGFGGSYIRSGVFYGLQGIEMDARRFARRRIEKINAYFKSIGHEDPNFVNCTAQILQDEKDYISSIRANLTLKDVEEMEKRLIDTFRRNRPDVKVENLNIFYHVKLVLMYPEIVDPQAMLDLVDSYLEGKLGMLSTKLDVLRDDRLNTFGRQLTEPSINILVS